MLTSLQISLPCNLLVPALADVEQPEDITLLLCFFFSSETKSVTVEKAEMNTSVTQVEMCCFNFPLAFQQRNPGCGGSMEIYLLAAVNPHCPKSLDLWKATGWDLERCLQEK